MPVDSLSRRERQIMDVLYRKGHATAAEVLEAIDDAPGYSAIRALLRILEQKGHIVHEQDGARYVYAPAAPADQAKRSAMRRLLDTFFDGSVEAAVAALLDDRSTKLSEDELQRIGKLIRKHQRQSS